MDCETVHTPANKRILSGYATWQAGLVQLMLILGNLF